MIDNGTIITALLGLIAFLLGVIAFFLKGFVKKVEDTEKDVHQLQLNDKVQDNDIKHLKRICKAV